MTDSALVYTDYRPDQAGLREALCTLGNGYFATRAAHPEVRASHTHYPGTYQAGAYNRLETTIDQETVENEDLVNLPNWLPLTFRLPGSDWFTPDGADFSDYRQTLAMDRGVLERDFRFRDGNGRETRVIQRQLVHMEDMHLGAQEVTLLPVDWEGTVEVRAALDGRVENAGVARYQALNGNHLESLEAEAPARDTLFLRMRTRQSHRVIAQAARLRVYRESRPLTTEPAVERDAGFIALQLTFDVSPERPARIEKIMALFSSTDRAISEPGLAARKAVDDAPCFTELEASQSLIWSQLWRRFDLEIDTPTEAVYTRRILRLHLFHLLQTASYNTMDLDTGIPARGLHGEAYRGHIFWDELFVFPLFNLRIPEITRSLLMYRYRRLDEARRAARQSGFWGAMFPWQSGSSGREESQRLHLNPRSGHWIPDHSRLQRHVNSAIAYNVWQYFQVTGDREFLSFYGAEMILEIARFWASICSHDPDQDRYEIRGIIGPDEYHDAYPRADRPGLDNNAYTNVMAVWVLCRALEIPELLPGERWVELCETLGIEDEEFALWDRISRRMRVPFHDDGIISQFEGYGDLEEFDWQGHRERYGDIDRLDRILEAENDTPNHYKASKQADVLMLFYLFSSEELSDLFGRLGYPFEYETIPRNIDYYLQRTSHGSTLSRVVHSWVLSRLDRARSWHLFREALESDVSDIQGGTTPEGIHTGAMAGTVDLVQRCYTGIEVRGQTLWFNPRLPEELDRLGIRIRYRGHSLAVEISDQRMVIRSAIGRQPAIPIGVQGRRYELAPGDQREFELHHH